MRILPYPPAGAIHNSADDAPTIHSHCSRSGRSPALHIKEVQLIRPAPIVAVLSAFDHCPAHFSAGMLIKADGCLPSFGRQHFAPTEWEVYMLMMIKDARPIDLVRHLEYHLMLGISHAIYIDNFCNQRASLALADSLTPYITRGVVTLITDFRCANLTHYCTLREIPRRSRGSGSIAVDVLRLPVFSKLQPPKGSLLVPIDEDEYVVLSSTRHSHTQPSLAGLASQMHRTRVSAVNVNWHPFGSSGHICQPPGAVVREFVHRAPLDWKSGNRHDPNLDPLIPTQRSKPIFLWDVDCDLTCSTHSCKHSAPSSAPSEWKVSRNNGTMNGTRFKGLGGFILYIAHYSYQSLQRMESKEMRGHTSGKLRRPIAHVPELFERVKDHGVAMQLDKQIALLKQPELKRCLSALFSNNMSRARSRVLSSRRTSPAVEEKRRLDETELTWETSYKNAVELEAPICPALPLISNQMPTPAVPLIFFHLRKVGGTELRGVLAKAGKALKLSYFIPCFAGQPGSWLELLKSDKRSGVRRRCNTYTIDALLDRPQEPSKSTFMQSGPSLYAGHLPYHVSTQFGVAPWLGKREFQQRPSGQFSCILAVREPVERFQSCYKERLSAGMGGRPLENLSSPELLEVFKQTDGMHSCSNEIARWIAPTTAWGEERLSEPGIILSTDELLETQRRMNRCVVVNIIKDCDGTVQVLRYWFPWLAHVFDHEDFCGKRTRKHATSYSAAWATADVTIERDWRWHAIAKHNLQDVELYEYAMRRFHCLLDRVPGVAKKLKTAAVATSVPKVSTYLPKGCSVTPRTTGPRIAVSFYGVVKSYTSLGSIRTNLVKPLQRVGSVDLFVHLMQPHSVSSPRSLEGSAKRSLERNASAIGSHKFISALSPCRFGITDQAYADLELAQMVKRSANVVGHGNPKRRKRTMANYGMKSIRNLFRSRLSMRTSAMLVKGHMEAHRIVYTHLALVRPDVNYQTPLVFDPTNTRAQVRVPDWGHDFCTNLSGCAWAGVNDRFAIGELPVLLPLALERLVQLSRYSVVHNSEHLWCAGLAEAKVTVGLLHGMRLIRIRTHGLQERRDLKPHLPLPPLLCVKQNGLKLVKDWNATMSELYAQSISSQQASCAACFWP